MRTDTDVSVDLINAAYGFGKAACAAELGARPRESDPHGAQLLLTLVLTALLGVTLALAVDWYVRQHHHHRERSNKTRDGLNLSSIFPQCNETRQVPPAPSDTNQKNSSAASSPPPTSRDENSGGAPSG